VKKPKKSIATAAARQPHSAGGAGAGLPYAKSAWKKISGECPAMELPGSALTAEARMVSETSNAETFS